jgi:N-acetylmuramoyl-L-alanine amidase
MPMSATVAASLDLVRTVLGSYANVTGMASECLEKAGFPVLKSPDVPLILVKLASSPLFGLPEWVTHQLTKK